jgi:SAM-dependent methyltransferase
MNAIKKLNFGCGTRLANGWINIDFHSYDSRVRQVNLLAGFPFPDAKFDAVYSSHVLEHFTREQAQLLLRESYRVLKPGGILRVVVPDFEDSCREYLRVLALPDNSEEKALRHSWMMIELLDQLVRTVPSGEMGAVFALLRSGADPELLAYVRSRTENSALTSATSVSAVAREGARPWPRRLRGMTSQKLATKLNYWYLKSVTRLIPKNLRTLVLIETPIGERHRWMYDRYSLRRLLNQSGFGGCQVLQHDQSGIPGFVLDRLDTNADGSPYKNVSIYMEATKERIDGEGVASSGRAP